MSSDVDVPEAAQTERRQEARSRRQTAQRKAARVEPQADSPSFRHRVHMVLEAGRSSGTIGLGFEIFLIALIVSNAVVVSLDSVATIAAVYGRYFQIFEFASVAIFTLEYGLRLWCAPEDPRFSERPLMDRLRYAMQPYMLIDLIAIAPAYIALFMPFADLRILRLFRLFRLLKIARYSPAVSTLIHVLSLERRALFGTLLLLLCLMCLSAEGIYIIEGTAQPKVFGDLPTCMYWAIITLTTVGYGDITPITALGRAWAGITAILGLGMFALPVGIIASAFMTEIHRRDFIVTSGMLARIPFFSGLSIETLSEVMVALRSQMVAPHVPIIVEGETASTMYFVVSGLAKSMRTDDGSRKKATLGPGDLIGADAVLSGRSHDASVFAHTPMRLLALSSQDIIVLLRKFPRLRRRFGRTAARAERKFQPRRQKGERETASEFEEE